MVSPRSRLRRLGGAGFCVAMLMACPQYTTVAALHRRLSVGRMLLHWFICFWGNLAGALFTMCLIFGCRSGIPCCLAFIAFALTSALSLSLSPSSSWARGRCFRRLAIPRRGHRLRNQEAGHARLPPDLAARHRLQLARVPGLLPGHAGQGPELQGRRHVVAHLRLRHARPGPRRGQHVLHPHGPLAPYARLDRGAVRLERSVALALAPSPARRGAAATRRRARANGVGLRN